MIKLLSYNLSRCQNFSITKCVNDIFKLDVDIIALQEVLHTKTKNISKLLSNKLKGDYRFLTTVKTRQGQLYGISLISKYPILDNQTIIFKNQKTENRGLLGIKVKIRSEVYWVLNTHLQWDKKWDKKTDTFPTITDKQLGEIYHICHNLYPKNKIILMGDLNITPEKKSIKKLYKIFRRYNLEESTYSVKKPEYIIDYILISKNIRYNIDTSIINYRLSNHRPVLSKLNTKNTRKILRKTT